MKRIVVTAAPAGVAAFALALLAGNQDQPSSRSRTWTEARTIVQVGSGGTP